MDNKASLTPSYYLANEVVERLVARMATQAEGADAQQSAGSHDQFDIIARPSARSSHAKMGAGDSPRVRDVVQRIRRAR